MIELVLQLAGAGQAKMSEKSQKVRKELCHAQRGSATLG